MKIPTVHYYPLAVPHFADVLALGNQVHGAGYLTSCSLAQYHQQGLQAQFNAGWVAYDDQGLAGFRLAFAAGQWSLDQWCSPELWPVPADKTAYFKCNTVRPDLQGFGIGGQLLQHSITALCQQGALAGVAHLWRESPGNAAVRYFSKHGGQLVRVHPDKWRAESLAGYACVRCGFDCHCSAAEMVLDLKKNQLP